jgi:hypothetical protein
MSAMNGPGPAEAGAGTGTAAPSPAARRQAAQPGTRPSRWAWPVGYALAAILLFFCYLRISGTQAVTSDGASMALQAWDMLHGNWLLKGWSLTDVSFYTTELPEYIVVGVFRGLGPQDVHTAAALTYTLLVVLAGLLAKGSKTGKEGLVRVLIASGIMIAPQVGPGAFLLLLSPDHTGTGVPLLLIFLFLDRAGRRPWVPAAAGLLLAWAQIGDRIVVTIGVLPVVAVCVARACREAIRRRNIPRECWFEAALAVAAVASVGVADVFAKIIKHLGGYTTAPLNTQFSPAADWPSHAMLALKGILGLYAADVNKSFLTVAAAVDAVHLIGLALAVIAFALAIWRFFKDNDLIEQILVVAIIVNVAAYVASVLPNTFWDNREIASVLPFGAVLAGRLLAGRLMKVRLLPALAVVACCYLFALGYGVTRPQVPAHDQPLTDWLSAHHLTDGLGSYAEGNSVTLDSHGSITLLAPVWRPHAVRPGTHEAKAPDFDPARHHANFVVTTMQDGSGFYIPPAWIINAFGRPAHTYHYGVWTIMTWNKNLLREVR